MMNYKWRIETTKMVADIHRVWTSNLFFNGYVSYSGYAKV